MPARIKIVSKPKKLYRYRALTDKHDDPAGKTFKQEIKAIKDNYIWASNFKAMNDPMEGLYKGDDTFRERVDLYHALFQSKLNVGIVSFSETPTNELMWAHYTNNMRGICIEYDVSKLLAELDDDDQLVRMTYDEEMPVISKTASIDSLARSVLGRKNHRWSQEREWRLMTTKMNEVRYNNPECITRIILGTNLDNHQTDRFEELTQFEIKYIDVDDYKLTVVGSDDPPRFAVS
ncbi:Protein of unknown function [Methylobacterium sp. 190mf]|uniref:DUF2971 domain-containing protein n=1 Tax=Methylobacterium sp. 190mf TaxID=1761798 RepID=UPI00089ED0D3|nr:DUF2971 domain-containing protein [Methylobacterium sp. 190mf]SEG53886.1 Protein of unknown function [Methylobacterium sp. 190mf]